MRILFLLLVLLTLSCAQDIPKEARWSHDYKTAITGTPIDTSNLVFDIMYSGNINGPYQMLAEGISDTSLYLLQFEELYADKTWYMYCVAWKVSPAVASAPSDTASSFFPFIKPDKSYNFKILKF